MTTHLQILWIRLKCDFTKAFHKVNYWKLFMKLLDDNINSSIVSLLAFWYSHQQVCVRWRNTLSDWFLIGNGTRQGSILSPYLCARYIRDLLADVCCSGYGCNVGGVVLNILSSQMTWFCCRRLGWECKCYWISLPLISPPSICYAMQRSQYQWLLMHRNVKIGLYLLASLFLNLVMLQFSLLTSLDISAI